MTHTNLENLSRSTLIYMIKDLNNKLSDSDRAAAAAEAWVAERRAMITRPLIDQAHDFESKEARDLESAAKARHEVSIKFVASTGDLNDDQALCILGLVVEICVSAKIKAIKAWRQRTGHGLVESKEAIEQWRSRIRV